MRIKDILDREWECTCLGCSIAARVIEPPGGFIIETDGFILHQDPEIPIKAFLIIASKQHIQSVAQLKPHEAQELFDLVYKARLAMESIGIYEVTLIQEERSQHFHLWLLPRYEWMNHQFRNSLAIIREMFATIKEQHRTTEILGEILSTVELIKQNFASVVNPPQNENPR
jgi:diadenosine tetraphosphate (Ap4A) HIT family hydrolase